jgi:hypothetical protein
MFCGKLNENFSLINCTHYFQDVQLKVADQSIAQSSHFNFAFLSYAAFVPGPGKEADKNEELALLGQCFGV